MEIEAPEISIGGVIFLIILLAAATLAAYGAMQFFLTIKSQGVVKAVGCKVVDVNNQTVTQIDWGVLAPGETKSFNCRIFNNGTAPITLNLQTKNWNPQDAANFITLTWNYTGEIILPKTSCPVAFVLTVSPDISGIDVFTFDTVIIATEVE